MMARASSIKRLPPEIKQEIDQLLADGKHTIDEIVAALRDLGANVSRSAVGRYAQDFGKVSAKMREARTVATAFAQELGEIPDNDMGRALVEMLHHMIFKMMLARSDEEGPATDPLDLARLAMALKNAALTNSLSVDLELKIRQAERKAVEEEMRSKLAAAVGNGGFDPVAAEEARRIMGFA
jgi:hypothetical protein